MPKAIVLLSGGQDSTTCLAIAKNLFPNDGEVEALCFDYGQRHRIEIEKAHQIAKLTNTPLKIINATWIAALGQNALTNATIAIQDQSQNTPPNTCVEGRNLFFLSIAGVIAKEKKAKYLYTGVCETDFSGYPDCRNEFITSLNTTLNLALNENLSIVTPLMWLSKAQSVLKMKELGKLNWYAHTHTCYEGKTPPCQTCPACKLRERGFVEAGIPDPLL